MEVSEPMFVYSILDIQGVNSLWLGSLQIKNLYFHLVFIFTAKISGKSQYINRILKFFLVQ